MSISEKWRRECLVDDAKNFLNLGTLAPTLKSAFEAAYQSQLAWMRQGPGASLDIREARAYLNMMEEQDKCRLVMAKWLNTDSRQVALVGNVTDGINAAMQSLCFQPGDSIVTTDEEHDALRQPLLRLQQRFHIEIETVPFPKTEEDCASFADAIKEKLSSKTKLIAISEVSHRTGLRISTRDVVTVAKEHGDVWLLVDGAHAVGTSEHVLTPGVDFYVFPGHKWLFGPVGTGVLWVSERVLEGTSCTLSGSPMISAEGARYDNDDGAWRYEYGTRDWSKLVGLSQAIEFRQQWSEERIVTHYRTLGKSFRAGIETKMDRQLLGLAPLFSYPTSHSNEIANALWTNHRVIVKPQDDNIRISIPPWIDEDEAHQLGVLFGSAAKRIES